MFPTKKQDVDRHVEECLKKINSETERNLRCLSFAKQYFKIERYEEARRYVSTYLSVRPNSAEAHCLLGKCLEMLGRKEGALQAFTTSLRLDPKQNNLVMKVCELLASDDVEMDQTGAKYFCEMAQNLDPHNPAIFSLKQRIITSENDDPRDVSNLILKELESRPTDVKLRVRLLKHLLQHNMVKEAYKHASDIESKDLAIFHNNITWYEAIAEVLVKYQRCVSLPNSLGWEFWFLSVSVLDKLVSLSLGENGENIKTTTEYVSALFNFDQTLAKASLNISDCPDKHLIQEFLTHYRAQLCLHLATLVFKQVQKDLLKYKEASNITLPLLFAAYHSPPPDLQAMWFNHASEARRNLVRRWRKEGAFRCSQTGHILTSAAKDRKSIIIEKATHYSMGMWREQLFKKIFVTRDLQLKMKTSYFLTDQNLIDIALRLPDANELIKYDEEAQLVFPDSLHHHIWIALNNKLSDLKCTVFDGLQYSVKNLKNCGAETLNILDIQAFIYCATLCAKFNIENMRHISYYDMDKPTVLPAAVTRELGTLNQNIFFKAAYKMFNNEYDSALDQVRLTLVDGIKTLRCVDSTLDIKLLVTLAKTFAEHAKSATKQSEIEFNEARAEQYWKVALPILEKMKNNQAVSYPPNKLFNYKSKDIPLTEICSYIETGRLFSGSQLMKKKEYEKALRLFGVLKDPYASFYQAQIYKLMADQQTSQNKENVTSEMRSQNIILLSRARDCLYLTLDRLREPSVDQKHPLNTQLGTEIEKIERLLSRIDPDCTNRNECDGMSDENVSSADSAGEHYVTGYSGHNNSYFNNHNHSTPYRSDLFKREARPSPERLDAQLRQLTASKDAAINHILEHNKIMVESHKTLVDELRSFKDAVTNLTSTVDELKNMKHNYEEIKDIKKTVLELKTSIDELDSFKNVTDMVYEMKKEIQELKKDINKTNQLSDEDIYGINDYTADYNLTPNLAAYNSNVYQNYQARMPGAGSLYGPPPIYPLYPGMAYAYGGLGLPQAGGLPFGSDQQLAGITGQDFRAISAALSQVQPTPTTYGQSLPQTTVPQTSLLTGQSLAPTPTQPNLFRDPKVTPSIASAPVIFSAAPVPATSTSKAPPVNVVITTSDPLPSTKTATSQPVLSVTIPPQHLKGNKTQPHNYQIPLPSTTLSSSSPSVLSKPSPAISTQSILSNVAPPVYSAVSDKPPMNVSLGLQIEKSLEQTFNSSKNDNSLNKSNISANSLDEHDPCPDFKPIIPLPDEVPVNTGEENETILFSERAKLFRYVTVNGVNEWKERGVGTFKILKNKETRKVRMLMRRDQVHKICANHFLTKEMILTPMNKSDRAYIWAAHDYADQELVVEKLCVRFKSADESKRFYDAFENAKKSLSDPLPTKPVDIKDTKVKPEIAKPQTSLGGFVFTSTPTFKLKEDTVATPVIQVESPKQNPFSGFTFSNKQTPFTQFSSLQSNFAAVPKTEDSSPSKPRKLTASDDWHVDDFVPTAEFKPVVPLPEVVEVKTGEENCEVLFETRAKVLRFDSSGETKEWKEKGTGVMKIVKDNTIRLLMRRDQVHKVCCNHQLLKNMEFKVMGPKALTWCAQDFSEGVLKKETLAIRFSTEEIANNFLKTIKSSQESLDDNNCVVAKHSDKHQKTESPVKPIGFGDKFKPVKGSWECKNCFVINDGKVNYCVACETPKNDSIPTKSDSDASGAAFSFGVANMGAVTNSWGSAFKPKEGSWECKSCYIRNDSDKTHCVSCETPKDDTVVDKPKEKGVSLDTGGLTFSFGIQPAKTVETQVAKSSGFGDLFKPDEGSWECKLCLIRNAAKDVYCLACESPKDDTVPKKEANKGVNLETPGQKYTFGLPAASTTNSAAKATFTFGQSTIQFGTKATESPAPFVFKPNVSLATPTTEKKDTSTEKFVFGSPQKHDFEFTPRSPRRISSGAKDEESDCSYVEEECDNIYFKPVIPLPEKVDVKTGEEEEEVLYCHRAKLFRFASGEWKERGLGDIKILKSQVTGKLRILMRREQVFKICLNHILTSDVKYLPKDEKTWLFYAADFSEGALVNEQFCIRFKNADIAQEFMEAVNNALNAASTDTGTKPEPKSADDDEVQFVSETEVTPEEAEEALKLGLPRKYFAYRQLPDCFCDQCKKDDVYLKDLLEPKTSEPITTIFKQSTPIVVSACSSTTSGFSSPKEGAFAFKSPPPEVPTTTTSSTLKDLLSKPSLLLTPKAGVFSTPSIFSNTGSTVFGTPSATSNIFSSNSSVFGTPTESGTAPTTGFSFAATTNTFNPSTTNSSPLVSKSTGNFFTSGYSIFSGNANTSGSIFGSKSASSIFTTPSTQGETGSIFGGDTTTTTAQSIFKTTQSASLFGSGTPTTTTTTGSIFKNSSIFSTPSTTTSIFGGGTGTLFGGSSFGKESATPIFGAGDAGGQSKESVVRPTFGASIEEKAPDAKTVNLKEDDAVVLDCQSGVSFASLAAKVNTDTPPGFTKNKNESNITPFAFLGAGAPVFSSGSNANDSKNKSSLEDTQENVGGDEEYDPHYDPIVPLPDTIVVSTGEEDEEVLFNERAKLFRYDADNKEWKERGVGQMKILHHPVNNTYRFLLRREQVHKVVLNQLIIPDLELQTMKTSDKAWIWAGYNYTDDGPSLEKLAIRFKNCESAQSFHKKVQGVVDKVKTIEAEKIVTKVETSDEKQPELIPSTIQNFGVEDVSSDDQAGNRETSYEEEDDEDEDDDDDRTVMFMKRCTLSEETNGTWTTLAVGDLQVYYDPDLYATRICVSNDNGEIVSNTIIGINTTMQLDKHSCIWRSVEWSFDEPKYRILKATFSSNAAAEEFHCIYLEGLSYAQEFDVVDEIPTHEEETE